MSDLLYNYSALLFFDDASRSQIAQLKKIAAESGIKAFMKFQKKSLELQYIGRDTNRKVIRFLKKISEIFDKIEGEVKCEIDDADEIDLMFEYYTFKDKKLFCQKGMILRGEKAIVK